MSLINKMLQDLEERSPETAGDPLHPSIRPAPARRGIHPAWLAAAVAIAVFAIAIAGLSWHRMHKRIAEIPMLVQQAQLPLKMADRLSIPATLSQTDPVSPSGSGTADAPAMPVAEPPPAGEKTGVVESKRMESAATEGMPPAAKADVRAEAGISTRPAAIASLPRERTTESRPMPAAEAASAPAPAARPIDPSAIAAAKQVHELTPHEKAENEYRKAAGMIQQGRSAEALALLEQGLAFDPRHAGARQALIGLLLDARRFDDAISRAKEGLALDSAQIGLAMILARLQVDRDDLPAAVATLQRSLPAGAENADYRAFYAALMQRSGNHKEAVTHYAAALRMAPQNGVWWMGLGISLQAEGRATEARDAYVKAKSSGSLSPALLAFVEQRLGQLPQR